MLFPKKQSFSIKEGYTSDHHLKQIIIYYSHVKLGRLQPLVNHLFYFT